MQTYLLADAASATGQGSEVTPANADGIRSGILQVEITNSASVTIQGRIDSTFSWVTLNDVAITANGAITVALMPHMRLAYTITSGTVSAKLIG